MHALQGKTNDGFFKGMKVVAGIIGRVRADGNRKVEHLAWVGTVDRLGSFVMVKDMGGLKVAGNGAMVIAVVDGDGLFNEVDSARRSSEKVLRRMCHSRF